MKVTLVFQSLMHSKAYQASLAPDLSLPAGTRTVCEVLLNALDLGIVNLHEIFFGSAATNRPMVKSLLRDWIEVNQPKLPNI